MKGKTFPEQVYDLAETLSAHEVPETVGVDTQQTVSVAQGDIINRNVLVTAAKLYLTPKHSFKFSVKNGVLDIAIRPELFEKLSLVELRMELFGENSDHQLCTFKVCHPELGEVHIILGCSKEKNDNKAIGRILFAAA